MWGILVISANTSQLNEIGWTSYPINTGATLTGMHIADATLGLNIFGKRKEIKDMRTAISFVLGAVLFLGAATLGLESGSANARQRYDRDDWARHHRHHHHHRHHYWPCTAVSTRSRHACECETERDR